MSNKKTDIDIVALATRFMHPKEFYLNWDWYRKGIEDQLEDRKKSTEQKEYFLNAILDLAEPKDIITNFDRNNRELVLICINGESNNYADR